MKRANLFSVDNSSIMGPNKKKLNNHSVQFKVQRNMDELFITKIGKFYAYIYIYQSHKTIFENRKKIISANADKLFSKKETF